MSDENQTPAQQTTEAVENKTALGDKTPEQTSEVQKTTTEVKQTETKETPVQDKPEAKPVVPEKYDLKLPKNSDLDKAYVEKFEAEAKAKGLTNEQAQSLLERDSGLKQSFHKEQKEFLKAAADQWFKEAKEDKEIGGENFKENVEIAKRAMNQLASEGFVKVLNDTGLGNNPDLIRVFLKMGKMMSNDRLATSNSRTQLRQSAADLLYPTTKQKES